MKRTSDLERVSFSEGQRLEARDLQAALDYEARLAALHVHGLHDTWGIVEGLGVWVANDGNDRPRVKVAPGTAYDTCGRLICLQSELCLEPPPLPPCPGSASCFAWYDLVIRYAETSELLSGQLPRLGGQGPSPCPQPALEQPVWRWALAPAPDGSGRPPLARDVRLGIEIPLARIAVSMTEPLVELVAFDFRHNARRMIRPHVAGGHLARGSLAVQGNLLVWSVVIDTTEGGFSRTPQYFVTLAEHPLLILLEAFGDDLTWVVRYALGPFIWIHEQQRCSFVLSLGCAIPRFAEREECDIPPFSEVRELRSKIFAQPEEEQWKNLIEKWPVLIKVVKPVLPALDWLGVEPASGCHEAHYYWHVGLSLDSAWPRDPID